jgi:hypothetical protein
MSSACWTTRHKRAPLVNSINPAQGQYICDTFVLLDLISNA